MLNRVTKVSLRQVVGVVYISPYASPEALRRILRFVKEHARGHHRWGWLYKYPMIEFDDIDDLTAMRTKFAKHIDGYKDLSDCPEPVE
jgi:hypothetical protein